MLVLWSESSHDDYGIADMPFGRSNSVELQWAVSGGQWSVISGRCAVVSGRRSVGGDQWSVGGGLIKSKTNTKKQKRFLIFEPICVGKVTQQSVKNAPPQIPSTDYSV
jgi:hypothetical protein